MRRSSEGMLAVRDRTCWRMASRSSRDVSVRPARTQAATAASQPARLNTKVIAGSSPDRSSCLMTSGRLGAQTRRCGGVPAVPRPGPPPGRPRGTSGRRPSSRARRTRSGLIRHRVADCIDGPPVGLSRISSRASSRACSTSSTDSGPPLTNRSCISRSARTCCHRGTGRCSLTTTRVCPRTVTNQSANSSALLTVADNDTSWTRWGRWMITSSHTAPRWRSAR